MPAIPEEVVTTAELAGYALVWAKTAMPEAYYATLERVNRPDVFRTYLLRLLLRRWEQDPAWRAIAPLAILEETAVTATLRDRRTGRTFRVGGRLAAPREMSWNEVLMCASAPAPREAWDRLLYARDTLDLVPAESAPILAPASAPDRAAAGQPGPVAAVSAPVTVVQERLL